MSASYYDHEEHDDLSSEDDHGDIDRIDIDRRPAFLNLSGRVLSACEGHDDHRPIADR